MASLSSGTLSEENGREQVGAVSGWAWEPGSAAQRVRGLLVAAGEVALRPRQL